MDTIFEPARRIPVAAEADVCVIGGGCTGAFAALRAARLGASVVLIEGQNRLGGAATSGLVNVWHTLYDMTGREQIIAGLTQEVLGRLDARGALGHTETNPRTSYNFNPCELTILLDEMTAQAGIRVFFHTTYCAAVREADEVKAIVVENKNGRQAIRARFFIDATGDGDAARDLGIEPFKNKVVQPPSACFHLQGNTDGVHLGRLVREHGAEFGLDDDWGWSTFVAGCEGIAMRADNHVFGVLCSDADDLTRAETEGRRLCAAFLRLLQKYGRSDTHYAITNLCSYIGVRETVHYRTRFTATGWALLTGERYEDPILNGTYTVDIHHDRDNGITFRSLSGEEETVYGKGTRVERRNWREDAGLTGDPAPYYQVPFSLLVPDGYKNFIAAGRMLNADDGAFGALRVMVNLNQLGEAAGVAAALCADGGEDVRTIDGKRVTAALRKGGSAV